MNSVPTEPSSLTNKPAVPFELMASSRGPVAYPAVPMQKQIDLAYLYFIRVLLHAKKPVL